MSGRKKVTRIVLISLTALGLLSCERKLQSSAQDINVEKTPMKTAPIDSLGQILDEIREEVSLTKHYKYSEVFPQGISLIELGFLDVNGQDIDVFESDQKFYGRGIKAFVAPNLKNFLDETYDTKAISGNHLKLLVVHYVFAQNSTNQKFYLHPAEREIRDLTDRLPKKILADYFTCAKTAECFNVSGYVTSKNSKHFFGRFEKQSEEAPVEAICLVRVNTTEIPEDIRAKWSKDYATRLNNCLNYFAEKLVF